MASDWFWEGNVQAVLASHLESEGWIVRAAADTTSKQHGLDLLLERDGRTLAIEVKGYPSEKYGDPRRGHETKRTNPRNQCEKWFSQALFKAMRLRSSMVQAEIAVAFPDFARYQALLRETEDSIRRLGVGVYLVEESRDVSLVIPHSLRAPTLDEVLLPFDAYEGGGRRLLGYLHSGVVQVDAIMGFRSLNSAVGRACIAELISARPTKRGLDFRSIMFFLSPW